MKIIFSILFLLFCSQVYAATLTLTDGRTVDVDAIHIDGDEVIAQTGEGEMTYFVEQIQTIDGKSLQDAIQEDMAEKTTPTRREHFHQITATIEELSEEDKAAIKDQFLAYRKAFEAAGTFAELREYMDPGKYADIQNILANNDSMTDEHLMAMIKIAQPENITVESVVLENGKAILKARADSMRSADTTTEGAVFGNIEFTRHDDGWKVFMEDWKMTEAP